jgi:iron-sulfur cluster insertion protein
MELSLPPRVTDRAFRRIAEINDGRGDGAPCLRVAVEGGGCSGFQYDIRLEPAAEAEDVVIEKDGQRVLIDPVSLPFLANAEIDFSEELIGARFVINNPNATAAPASRSDARLRCRVPLSRGRAAW